MANSNGFIKMAVGALVVIIVAVSVILPIFAGSADSVADKETLTNSGLSYAQIVDGETKTLALAAGVYTIDGETVEFPAATSSLVLAGEKMAIERLYYNGSILIRFWLDDQTALKYAAAFNLTISADNVTGTITTTANPAEEITVDVDGWTYLYDAAGDYVFANGNESYYVNSLNDLVLSGLYSTGENDTVYSFKDGTMYTYGDYEASTTGTLTAYGNSYDGYTLSDITVSIGDETFTPYRCLVPKDVTVHNKNLEYTLVGIIPVLILVGVLMMIVTAFISNRRA